MKNYILTFLIFISNFNFSQVAYDPLQKPNTYRNIDNPNYWKNKMPHAAYWQQDIYYNIKANIDEETDIIDAYEELTYWNNSPDTLALNLLCVIIIYVILTHGSVQLIQQAEFMIVYLLIVVAVIV